MRVESILGLYFTSSSQYPETRKRDEVPEEDHDDGYKNDGAEQRPQEAKKNVYARKFDRNHFYGMYCRIH